MTQFHLDASFSGEVNSVYESCNTKQRNVSFEKCSELNELLCLYPVVRTLDAVDVNTPEYRAPKGLHGAICDTQLLRLGVIQPMPVKRIYRRASSRSV